MFIRILRTVLLLIKLCCPIQYGTPCISYILYCTIVLRVGETERGVVDECLRALSKMLNSKRVSFIGREAAAHLLARLLPRGDAFGWTRTFIDDDEIDGLERILETAGIECTRTVQCTVYCSLVFQITLLHRNLFLRQKPTSATRGASRNVVWTCATTLERRSAFSW